jgi:hypothetical protein
MVKKIVDKGKTYKESVTPRNLEKYLGIPRFRRSEIERKNEVGVALGMAGTCIRTSISTSMFPRPPLLKRAPQQGSPSQRLSFPWSRTSLSTKE